MMKSRIGSKVGIVSSMLARQGEECVESKKTSADFMTSGGLGTSLTEAFSFPS